MTISPRWKARPTITGSSCLRICMPGRFRALWLLGQNPAVSGPNSRLEREALKKLKWMVVQETLRYRDLLLLAGPGCQSRRYQDRGVYPAGGGRHGKGGKHRHQRPPDSVAAQSGRGARRGAAGPSNLQFSRPQTEGALCLRPRPLCRSDPSPQLGLRKGTGRGESGPGDQRLCASPRSRTHKGNSPGQ